MGTEKTEYWISLRDGRTNTKNDEVFTMLKNTIYHIYISILFGCFEPGKKLVKINKFLINLSTWNEVN